MTRKATTKLLALAAILAVVHRLPVCADRPIRLGPPPELTSTTTAAPGYTGLVRASLPAIDINNRDDVVSLFNTAYKASQGIAAQWTGDMGTCAPGTTALAYEEATLLRVNYYRVMTGLPGDITLDSSWNGDCQDAALMMIAQGALNHFPDASWACYTAEGAAAAGKSNLALGAHGPGAIDGYIQDPPPGNEALGHRRWVFYPPQQTMGTGSTTGQNGFYFGSNALWVLGPFGSRPATPEWVAWPPPGFVPYQVVYPRWSFSLQGAGFDNAMIAMTHKGNPVSLTKLPVDNRGFGDRTVAWEPSGIPSGAPSEDLVYTVTITNVDDGGTPRQFQYNVTIIDPDAAPPTGVDRRHWQLYN